MYHYIYYYHTLYYNFTMNIQLPVDKLHHNINIIAKMSST